MDRLDKVEKLRERANVSYEEAKAALDQAGDDLLEAMVLLEKQGKTRQPEQSTYSTSSEEQKEYIRVQEKVEEQEKSAPTLGKTISRAVKLLVKLITSTSFRVIRKEKTVFAMPTWVAALILLFTWRMAIPVMVIALFFGVRYTFEGLDDETQAANDLLNRAGDFADNVENELHKEE